MKRLLLVLFTVVLMSAASSIATFAENKNITLPLKAAQIDTNCNLVDSINVSKDGMGQFEQKFGTKILSIRNDIFNDNGKRLQLNYIKVNNSEDAEKVYKKMVDLVGNVNVVALKENTVIEIMSNDIATKNELITKINASKVHKHY